MNQQRQRIHANRLARHSGALVQIHRLLNDQGWDDDTCEDIASIVRSAGFPVREPDPRDLDDYDPDHERALSPGCAKETR